MKLKSFYFTTVLLLGITVNLNAQIDSLTVNHAVNKSSVPKQKPPSNFVKINLFGIALKNYQVQYERALTRKISIAIAYRTMPLSTIPFKNQIIKLVGTDDPDTKETIEKLRIGNFAITPEIRFYLSRKGYGRGFYIAPFYRYASFTSNNMAFNYGNGGDENTINLSGKLTANTGGILFGVQKALGKHVCLDWWLLGPHVGSGTGNFTGLSIKPLTPPEQEDLRQQLNDIDIPLTDKTVNVTSNSASLKLDGPWAGLRTGLSIGVRF